MGKRGHGYVLSTKDISQMRDGGAKAWMDEKTEPGGEKPRRARRRTRPAGEHPENCLCRRCEGGEGGSDG